MTFLVPIRGVDAVECLDLAGYRIGPSDYLISQLSTSRTARLPRGWPKTSLLATGPKTPERNEAIEEVLGVLLFFLEAHSVLFYERMAPTAVDVTGPHYEMVYEYEIHFCCRELDGMRKAGFTEIEGLLQRDRGERSGFENALVEASGWWCKAARENDDRMAIQRYYTCAARLLDPGGRMSTHGLAERLAVASAPRVKDRPAFREDLKRALNVRGEVAHKGRDRGVEEARTILGQKTWDALLYSWNIRARYQSVAEFSAALDKWSGAGAARKGKPWARPRASSRWARGECLRCSVRNGGDVTQR